MRNETPNAETSSLKARALLLELYETALGAALPATCLPSHLPPPPTGRLVVLAIGKAAASMSAAAEDFYAAHFPDAKIEGIALTRYGHAVPTRQVEVLQAAHPVPDAAGMAASQRLVSLALSLTENDLALVLISGGGSALATLPLSGLSLEEKRGITKQLLASGARIAEINCIRKHLSQIKGGWLARAIAPAPSLTLAISDVAGDAPDVIASGPTVPDPTTREEARQIAARYDISLPDAVMQSPETPKSGDTCFAWARFSLVASGAMSLQMAADKARMHGFEAIILGDHIEAEARLLASQHAELALDVQRQGRNCIILSGGEAGVSFTSPPSPAASGGPNQEYALALAIALQGARGISALACDTDGIDGGSGSADDPAGAMIFSDTLMRAAQAGLDPKLFLHGHDSGHFFRLSGDLVETGPSFTNVNDFRAIIVEQSP
jgi:glycerate 2-kinase